METSIDVLIPVHGRWELTERCLLSLREQTISHRVTVIDNASRDRTLELLRKDFQEVVVVPLKENHGFAFAGNRGVEASDGELVVLLNNDVVAQPDFLERLTEPLRIPNQIGSVAPTLLRPGNSTIDSVGIAADPTLAAYSRLQGLPAEARGSTKPVLLGPSGAAAAYRRSGLTQVAGLDEEIFMYHEDVDLALRLRTVGWESVVAPAAMATHLGSGTARRRSRWQRSQSAFSRGYLLGRYRILSGSYGPRALAAETIAAVGDTVISLDFVALVGRLRGFRRGRSLLPRTPPSAGIDGRIGFFESLRLRLADYSTPRS